MAISKTVGGNCDTLEHSKDFSAKFIVLCYLLVLILSRFVVSILPVSIMCINVPSTDVLALYPKTALTFQLAYAISIVLLHYQVLIIQPIIIN